MARKTPPAPALAALLAALTLLLAGCGGGSTAGPVAQSSDPASTQAQPPAATQPVPAPATAAVPRTTAAPRPAATHPRPHRARSRATGGAAAPAAPAAAPGSGSLSDASGASAGEAATTTAPAPDAPAPPPAARPAGRPLDERAALVLTRRVTNTHYFQQGTVTGTYDGTMATEARITSRGVLVRFTATLPGGTISGRAVAVAILDSTTWPALRGTAIVTGGTGRFAGIHGRRLKVTGRARPDASRARVRLAGTVSGF